MAHNAEQIKVDRKMVDSGFDPETGRDLRPLTAEAIRNHARFIYPHAEEANKANSDHARRYRLLMSYADGREARG